MIYNERLTAATVILTSVVQIIASGIIPLFWWFLTEREEQTFRSWIGFKGLECRRKIIYSIIIASLAVLLLGTLNIYAIKSIGTATSETEGLGAIAVPEIVLFEKISILPEAFEDLVDSPTIIYTKFTTINMDYEVPRILEMILFAIFTTALPEELLFRGFFLKRLMNAFGFNVANTIQAIVFGLLHGVVFFQIVGGVNAIFIGAVTLLTAVMAWVMGYINEVISEGSIIPSWIIHSVLNIFICFCATFSLI